MPCSSFVVFSLLAFALFGSVDCTYETMTFSAFDSIGSWIVKFQGVTPSSGATTHLIGYISGSTVPPWYLIIASSAITVTATATIRDIDAFCTDLVLRIMGYHNCGGSPTVLASTPVFSGLNQDKTVTLNTYALPNYCDWYFYVDFYTPNPGSCSLSVNTGAIPPSTFTVTILV